VADYSLFRENVWAAASSAAEKSASICVHFWQKINSLEKN
jgi:hypothetical protein